MKKKKQKSSEFTRVQTQLTSETATKHWDWGGVQCFAFKPLMCLICQLTEHYRTPPVFISMLCFLLWSWITFCSPTRTAIRAITKVKRIAGHKDSYNIHKQNYITPPHSLHRWPAACMDVEIFKACQTSGGINQTCSAAGTLQELTFTAQSTRKKRRVHDSAMDLTDGVGLGALLVSDWSFLSWESPCILSVVYLSQRRSMAKYFGMQVLFAAFWHIREVTWETVDRMWDSDHKGWKFTPLSTRWRHFDLKLCLFEYF